ncbi:MAG TPA: hypothetical protein PKM48_00810 [Parvularculaceae bacterium]|nr:hypothetical protein [Parvularculaceae bacterium]HNS86122.1 hypothetical protein [Parvularculaceae bacterium]
MSPLHAVAVALAVDPDGPLVGLLILGEPGAGKSSLALSLIETCPFQRTALVADDAVIIEDREDGLIASAPAPIRGLIEARGFGPAPARFVTNVRLRFAVDLSGRSARVAEPGVFTPADGVSGGVPFYPLRWKGEEALAAHRVRRLAVSILSGQLLQCTQDSE